MTDAARRSPVLRATLGVAALTVLGLTAGAGNAVAGGLVTSAKIKDDTIKSVDVRDGTLSTSDLSGATVGSLQGIHDYVVVSDEVVIDPMSDGSVAAFCPGNTQALGVTGALSNDNTGVQTVFTGTSSTLGTGGQAYATNTLNQPNTLTVQVSCARTWNLR